MVTEQKLLKKGYKFRLYPTAEQRDLLERTFGCCRYVYNRALAEAKNEYQAYLALKEANPLLPLKKPDVSGFGFSAKLPHYKADPESSWLREVSSIALQQSMLHLGTAFQRFFKEKKGYPHFKKKQNKQSFTLMAPNGFSLRDGIFTMVKCKTPLKVGFSRELPSAPSQCTISRTPSGKYYVSFLCTYVPEKTTGTGRIGIDLGIPKTHALDAACVGDVVSISAEDRPTLHVSCMGRGRYRRTTPDKHGFPKSYAPRIKKAFGFQTGDIARIHNRRENKKEVGRVAIRQSGDFNIACASKLVRLSYRYCLKVQSADGYEYSVAKQ